ncbi:MAG: EAL domain-containing protein [Nitrosomonadales bacterium]|nr:EAL domain-containing protein [Nitrosomonadales bacterium]
MSEEKFQALFDAATDCMLIIDMNGHIRDVNRTGHERLGYAKDELLGMHITQLDPPEFAARVPERIAAIRKHGQAFFESAHIHRNGSIMPVEVHSKLFVMEGQQVLFSVVRDISRHKLILQALRKSEQRYRSLFNHMVEGVAYCQMLYDQNGLPLDFRYVEVNPAFESLTGLNHITGKTSTEIGHGLIAGTPETFRIYAKVVSEGQPAQFETHIDALGRWLAVSAYATGDDSFIAVLHDITERKIAEAQINFLAHHDQLTGLPNRVLVQDRVEQAIAHADRNGGKVALLFLDLDDFKAINDTLGHFVGDGLLKEIAKRLRDCVRETDSVSRQGGDEFLIVLSGINDTDAISYFSTKILQRLAEPYHIEHHDLSTSVSIGIAVYPDDGTNFATLLKKADTAMYHAKSEGRNTSNFFDVQMNREAEEHLGLRNRLRQALQQHEFQLYYQPQVSMSTGRITGAEALLRWNHPELGLVPPARFIPLAEDSGMIVPIGEWVLREACRQAAEWKRAGVADLVVAVNLSAVQFTRGGLEQSVISALSDSGLDPTSLELELTESILIKNTEKVLQTVQRLKALGIKLSIDDFGTGYSSLAYLGRFAVDKLKIDQSFVLDLESNPGNAAIVRAIIQMARSFGLSTIAEGVERGELLDYLRLNHCDEAQGYFIARPIPADEFRRFLGNHQP